MADSNPFMAGVEGYDKGFNTAAGYAVNQAHLNLQQQQVQQQQEQIKQVRDTFNAKMGDQLFQDFGAIAQMPNGPLKKQQLKAKQDYYKQAGITVDDSWWSSAEDPNFQIDYATLMSNGDKAKIADPEGFNKAIGNLTGLTRNEFVPGMLAKASQGLTSLQLQAEKNKGMIEASQTRMEGTNMRASQKSYDSEIKPIKQALEGAGRAMALIDNYENAPEDKKVQLTKQIKTVLSNEEARLVTGKSNFGEGTAAGMSVDSYATQAREFANKLSDNPDTVISPEQIQQLKNFYGELSDQYMSASDRVADSLKGGATPAQLKVVEGRHQALKDTYQKRFGRWPGEEPAVEAKPTGAPKPDSFTPDQLQSAQKLKRILDSTPDGPQKAKILSKIQSTLSPELRKTLGLQ